MSITPKHNIKSALHIRNRNRDPYDIDMLLKIMPSLEQHIISNRLGNPTINFSNPIAVKLLNQTLLHHYYGVAYWDFPDTNLCPPIPGRADYIHYAADLLDTKDTDTNITCLDIGTGASCIYPIIGVIEYGWNFIASDISSSSLKSAEQIIKRNPQLGPKITLRHQENKDKIFDNIISGTDRIDITICNPPFHSSASHAKKGSQRKVKNLTGKRKQTKPTLNFSGNSDELIYPGGEVQFIHNMITESQKYRKQVDWFTTLVSKKTNLPLIYKSLQKVAPHTIQQINMSTGNKTSRIIAWSFTTKKT